MSYELSGERKVNLNVRVPEPMKEELRGFAEQFHLTLEELAMAVFADYIKHPRPIRKQFLMGD